MIISDDSNLEWADHYLDPGQITVLATGIRNEVREFIFPGSDRFVCILVLKDEKDETYAREDARIDAADLLEKINGYKLKEIGVVNHSEVNRTYEVLEGLLLGNYKFLKHFSNKDKKRNSLEKVSVHSGSMSEADVSKLNTVVSATCTARDFVNEPHSHMNAVTFSEAVKALGEQYEGLEVEVYDKQQIIDLGMGGLLSVNLGSVLPPTFNIMEWMPENAKNKKPIILVGKGVMFDTGGVSLKPTANSMDYMKCDMAGSAAVVGIMKAVADAKLPLNIVGLVGATDNRPGQDAYVPGDVITTMSGITVEVLNTDAEGRMTLADSLHYAKKYDPELVLDFATLTGSAARAIGPDGICYMGNADSKIKHALEVSGRKVYERLVEFPMWREYGDAIKSDIADIKNLGGPYAGMITAGKFLEHFTDYPWLHFDIAGPSYLHKKSGYRTKEGTGVGVRLIFDFLENYS